MNDQASKRQSPRRPLSTVSQDSDKLYLSRPTRSASPSPSMKVYSDLAPHLPIVVSVKECVLRRRGGSVGWGFTLRGTKSGYGKDKWIYNCFVEGVSENGPAEMAALKEGDQILCIDGTPVRDMEHSIVVELFQSCDKMKICYLPSKFKECSSVRITKLNKCAVDFLWAFVRHLQSVDIINVDLSDSDRNGYGKIPLSGLSSIRQLSVNHCSLSSLECLEGLSMMYKLESLSLAHNLLNSDSITNGSVSLLNHLKKLDLSCNLLSKVPPVVCNMKTLETLVLADNNIAELPHSLIKLERLQTLCLNGNLLCDIDTVLLRMPHVQKLTVANNSLECEVQIVRNKEFQIASVETNPYNSPNDRGFVSRNEPSLRRTLSVRGSILYKPNYQGCYNGETATTHPGIEISIQDCSKVETQ